MCKKLISLTFLISFLGLAGNVGVVSATDWTGAIDSDWTNPANWSPIVPVAGERVDIESTTPLTWPVLDGGTASCGELRVAYVASSIGELTVTGGATLNVGDELRFGRKESVPRPEGKLYISGSGTQVLVAEIIECGRYGVGIIDMSGGLLHSDEQLRLAFRAGSSGRVFLRGGTIELDGDPGIRVGDDPGEIRDNTFIDISGGTIILAGNQLSSVEGFISDGTIIAYGGQSTVLVTYDPGPDVTIVEALSLSKAREPEPADKATDVCRATSLSWTAPDFVPATNGHRVFLSTDFDSVNDGIGGVIQSDSQYAPAAALDFSQTYYWRVDEANGAKWEEGKVWQFTTEPIGYPIADVNATASSVGEPNEDMQPVNTVNGSGLAGELHSADMTAMWLSAAGGGGAGNPSPSGSTGAAWIAYEFPQVYRLHEMLVWNYNAFTNENRGMRNVTIEYSLDGITYSTLGTTHELNQAPGTGDYAPNTAVDFQGATARYVVITASTVDGNWGGDRYGLSEVRFLHVPMRASKPDPGEDATGVPVDAALTWKPGRKAQMYDVYFGTDEEAVAEGGIAPEVVIAGEPCLEVYSPSLELGKTYYWKVDAVNEADDPSMWEGEIWSFSTPDYIVVDDMETYTVWQVADNNIFEVWVDGMGNCAGSGNGTGANVFPYFDESADGSKSMNLTYDNDRSVANPCLEGMPEQPRDYYYSEATAQIADLPSGIGSDWTTGGIRALSLVFYGDPNNDTGATEQMYIKINGVKVEYDGEMEDIKEASWHEWNIDLALFAGADLTNVTQLSIGFGDENNTTTAGGSGVVYFDSIRLHPSRCVLSKRSADFAALDYAGGDCVVNEMELEMMSANWLEGDFTAPALMAWWKLDGDTADSSGNGRNGTAFGNPAWVIGQGQIGDALNFDGIDDYVNIDGYKGVLGGRPFTITAWILCRGDGEIVGWGGPDTETGQRVEFRVNESRLRCEAGGGNVQGGTNVFDSQWHHAAVTVKRNATISHPDVTIYLDGVDDTIQTVDLDTFNAVGLYDVQIGQRYSDSGERWFTGDLDDIRIYDRVLSPAEIASIMDGSAGTVSEYHPTEEENFRSINFKDLAVLGNSWLDVDFWP